MHWFLFFTLKKNNYNNDQKQNAHTIFRLLFVEWTLSLGFLVFWQACGAASSGCDSRCTFSVLAGCLLLHWRQNAAMLHTKRQQTAPNTSTHTHTHKHASETANTCVYIFMRQHSRKRGVLGWQEEYVHGTYAAECLWRVATRADIRFMVFST